MVAHYWGFGVGEEDFFKTVVVMAHKYLFVVANYWGGGGEKLFFKTVVVTLWHTVISLWLLITGDVG